jgi:hypothetical protein
MNDIKPLLKATHNYGFWKGTLFGFVTAAILFIVCFYKNLLHLILQ